MKRKDIKKWLKSYDEDNIYITKHITIDRAYRQIPEELIKKNILNPINLIKYKEQKSRKLGRCEFRLWFAISRSKTLMLVVELNEKIRVITAVMINEKWQRRVKWFKWMG